MPDFRTEHLALDDRGRVRAAFYRDVEDGDEYVAGVLGRIDDLAWPEYLGPEPNWFAAEVTELADTLIDAEGAATGYDLARRAAHRRAIGA